MITITESKNIPDSTYFTITNRGVEPDINDDGSLTIYNGQGSRRSWGAPQVTSTVVYQDEHIVAVHVGFSHKHKGGQGWRYYDNGDGQARQITWAKIPDETREIILEAYEEVAPGWAKAPGKLRKDYKSQNPKANAFTGYKIMAINEDGELTSLYAPNLIYKIGKTNVEQARPNHNGGYYVHLDSDEIKEKYLNGMLVNKDKIAPKAALVRCECWGRRIAYGYDNDKIAVTYCKPLEVIEIFEVS